jgi:hypothetical protein
VSVMEARLLSDPKAMESMAQAHQACGQERWESLTDADLDLAKTRKWEAALDAQRGMAGIRKPSTIKCLNSTHLAHYLSGGRGSEDKISSANGPCYAFATKWSDGCAFIVVWETRSFSLASIASADPTSGRSK